VNTGGGKNSFEIVSTGEGGVKHSNSSTTETDILESGPTRMYPCVYRTQNARTGNPNTDTF
jgi:hypothetical protein